MRLHLVLLALTLGCATEDSKTDDTSSNGGGDGSGEENGSGDDGDGGLASLISDVANMATEMAELSATIAAQQAVIAQLDLEVGELKDNTYRWETTDEVVCPDGENDDVYMSVSGDAVLAVQWYRWDNSDSWVIRWGVFADSDSRLVLDCWDPGAYDGQRSFWRVAYDW